MSEEREPTIVDVQALIAAATPHFAYQIRARVLALVSELPAGHPTRDFAEAQIAMLEDLGRSSSRAAEGPLEPPSRVGWETVPSHRPARTA